ncbi:two-component system, NarL family, nitrate/nitrite sensor histidine kinase NarX [Paenibacillus sp. UNCCL117]|nr:two-component system, NarL family, nitrate/nitrite sensor histidine kinase NarX [Paenibacillus sp. cl123]SFW40472.1 two-component system, NarL family, nitrate/nitrite sensor histidine kinase NarX [Paenibacillus sp. UNCCL117]
MIIRMSMRTLKWCTILLPPFIIGGFEYVRHDFMLHLLSMETGNLYITLLTLLLSYIFGTWMFRRIEAMNETIAGEKAKRAVYEERERLAEELHDNIAQVLFFLNVQLTKGQLHEAREAVSEIDHHLRQAIFNLRTTPEEGATFESRLLAWLEEWSGLTGINVEPALELNGRVIPPSAEVALFSIVREAFTNIRKHSHADQAFLELGRTEDGQRWRLRIADNGVGYDPEADASGSRYGLSILRKRALELHAELQFRSPEEGGVELVLTGALEEGKSL